MFKRKRFLALLVVVLFTAAILLTGCSTQKNAEQQQDTKVETGKTTEGTKDAETSKKPELDPVELNYYSIALFDVSDMQEINEKMNEILKEKINATIKLNFIDFGNYPEKMNVMEASGENYDLCWTSSWWNDYFNNTAKNAYIALDDLLPQYAPNLWKLVPKTVWDATRIQGKIYGAPNYQIVVEDYAMVFDMAYMKKLKEAVGFEVGDIMQYKKVEDLEPILEAIKKAKIPKSMGYPTFPYYWSNTPIWWGYDTIGSSTSIGWVKLDDPTMKVVNQYATPEYRNYVELMQRWYKAGYIEKDAAMSKGWTGDPRFEYQGPLQAYVKPGQVELMAISHDGREFAEGVHSTAYVTTNRATATLMAISKRSENPERALMFLDLMASDKGVFNILAWGIEGKHYVKVNENLVDFPEGKTATDVKYFPNCGWLFGNQFLEYLRPNIPTDVWERTQQVNEGAKPSPVIGFSFNPESVKTQIAACQAVLDEYIPALDTGSSGNWEGKLNEMLNKLEKAGSGDVTAEKERQILMWMTQK